MKKIYEMTDTVDASYVDTEDGGDAMIFGADGEGEILGDGCLFVSLQSWDEERVHPLMNEIIGKKIRITIEVED